MKTRLQRIEIQNFKAFRQFSLNLEGRHLLVYGPNGSGKSSLYWALYTFLQSSWKETKDVAKYFDANGTENLLNRHEQDETNSTEGKLTFVFQDTETKAETPLSISETEHQTHRHPTISKAAVASDFITYRFFFGFSHFRNSQEFNIWPLFEKEILPFCIRPGGNAGEMEKNWLELYKKDPNPARYGGTHGAKAYALFANELRDFSIELNALASDITDEAQRFYNQHFSAEDSEIIELKLAVTRNAKYDRE